MAAVIRHLVCLLAVWRAASGQRFHAVAPGDAPSQWELSLLSRDLEFRERAIKVREKELGIEPSLPHATEGLRRSGEEEILVFEDEFDDFDMWLWQHETTMSGGGNSEFQVYVNNRTNSWTEGGVLYIQPTLTADWIGDSAVSGEEPFELDIWGSCTSEMFYGCRRRSDRAAQRVINPIQSALVSTARSFSFRYGRVEMRAKIPKGDWIFPAFWMMPSESAYGSWPASGEIDILEARGNPPGYAPDFPDQGGYDMYSCCAHWGPIFELNQYKRTFDWLRKRLEPNSTLADEWHTYGFHWDETGMYTYLDTDENRVLQVTFDAPAWERGGLSEYPGLRNPWQGRGNAAPFDRPFYLVINVAIGGSGDYFRDGYGNKPWRAKDVGADAMFKFWEARHQWLPTWRGRDTAFKIDSVRVWQRRRDLELVSVPYATVGRAAHSPLSG